MKRLLVLCIITQLNIASLFGQTCVGSLLFTNSNDGVHYPASGGTQYYSSNGFTWECWIKLTAPFSSYSSQLLRPMITAIDPIAYEDICLSFGWSGGVGNVAYNHLCFKVDGPNGGSGASGVSCDYMPAGGFLLGTWYHVAGSMDYTNHVSKLYVNGALVDTKTVNSTPMTRVIATQLGWDIAINPGYPNLALGGNMDEVRIWKTVRTPTEIATYYNQCLSGNEPGLLSYFRCNQSSGTIATDASPNGLNGTLVNGAAWSVLQAPLTGSNCSIGCCPIITAGGTNTVCKGNTAQLTSSGGFTTYTWSPSAGLNNPNIQNPIASPTITTIYTVTGTYVDTNMSACTSVDCVLVTVKNPPVVTLPNYTTCPGQVASISPTIVGGTSPYTYQWSNGSTSAVYTVSTNSPTTYSLVVTDAFGCISQPASANIFVSGSLNVNVIRDTTLCSNIPCTLNESSANATAYSWSTGSNASSINVTSSGIYWVDMVIGQCSVRDSATVTILSTPTVSVLNYTACPGQTINIVPAIAGGTGSYSYNWGGGYTNSFYSTSPKADSVFSVSVTDADGCVATTASGSITVLPPLNVSVNGLTTCSFDTVKLVANVATGSGNYSYTWTPTGSHQNPLSIVPSNTTVYTVVVSDGCSISSDTANVIIVPAPNVGLPLSASGCAPVCINLLNIPYNSLSVWQWNFGDGATSSAKDSLYCYTKSGTYDLSFTYTTTTGCFKTVTSASVVTVFPMPVADFSASAFETDIFNSNINFYNTSINYNSSHWTFGDLASSSQQSPSHNYPAIGEYPVTLIVKNQYGCIDTVIKEIKITDIYTFYAPDAFSPNDDQLNDVFKPTGTGWDESYFKMYIYDRWGNLVLHTNDPYKGWDGKMKGATAQEDTYVWKVTLKDIFGKLHSYSGVISLIK
ncbi:MAG: PKD domain-containing protein [Bacteroidia bacterium]